MKIAITSLGTAGALLFFYSVYAFWVHPEQFKTVAYVFIFLTVVFFILVIIRKMREERELKKKIGSMNSKRS